jgi:predicted RNA-binding Zn-ribbon protein involved in translation (DUF1610 family)
MYHCDACGWDGDTPALSELSGEGCGGVLWTLRVCPECGEEVYETRPIRLDHSAAADFLRPTDHVPERR